MNPVELTDVTKCYRAGPHGPVNPVLRGISLVVAERDTLSITGPSGCGKSTLLNILGTLDAPTDGTVLLEGRPVAGMGPAELAAFRCHTVGFVFQRHHLLPQCTVLENVLLPSLALPAGPSHAQARQRAEALLDRVGLLPLRDRFPTSISGGECQRVALVRALVNRPKLLLADEPTGSLDRENAAAVFQLLLDLNRSEGTSLVLATHDVALADALPRRYELRHGTLEPRG